MISFPILRTRRLTIQLRELTISETAAIAALSPDAEQAECTAFLRAAVASVSQGESDPAKWTVEERTLAVCHYLAVTSADGPDFSVGDGHYSDYLDGAKDISSLEAVLLGEFLGDKWSIRPLTGRYAESIERILGEVLDDKGNPIPARLHWTAGAMAASLLRAGEELPPEGTDGEIDEWLTDRIRVLTAFPERDFIVLLEAFYNGREKISHLFTPVFRADGIAFLPKEGAADDLPLARFPARACLSEIALQMV